MPGYPAKPIQCTDHQIWQRRSHHLLKPNIPATGEFKGVGFLEAPRGMLSHWMVIKSGIISNLPGSCSVDLELWSA
ncbi:nickel-dependent hydrogenase large subunit [Escherichia coli]